MCGAPGLPPPGGSPGGCGWQWALGRGLRDPQLQPGRSGDAPLSGRGAGRAGEGYSPRAPAGEQQQQQQRGQEAEQDGPGHGAAGHPACGAARGRLRAARGAGPPRCLSPARALRPAAGPASRRRGGSSWRPLPSARAETGPTLGRRVGAVEMWDGGKGSCGLERKEGAWWGGRGDGKERLCREGETV